MTSRGSNELREYRRELRDIINSLKNLEFSLRNDFKNVGNKQCADSVNSVIVKYESALRTLNSVNASTLDRLKKTSDDAKKVSYR